MLDNVLVIAMSEFGRTPRINGHVGRDHWPEAWSLVMAGCGIKKGVVVGKTNDKGTVRGERRARHRPPVPHLVPGPGHRPGRDASTTTTASRCRSPTTTARPITELLA